MVDDEAKYADSLTAAGFTRISEFYCSCPEPDVWVAARDQGNEYRCGHCRGYVRGMETSEGRRRLLWRTKG